MGVKNLVVMLVRTILGCTETTIPLFLSIFWLIKLAYQVKNNVDLEYACLYGNLLFQN